MRRFWDTERLLLIINYQEDLNFNMMSFLRRMDSLSMLALKRHSKALLSLNCSIIERTLKAFIISGKSIEMISDANHRNGQLGYCNRKFITSIFLSLYI